MRIGLDFDGVISDCGKLKSLGAKKIFGLEIPSGKFKKEIIVGERILSLEQYNLLQEKIYGDEEFGFSMQPVEGALEFIPKLQEEKHEIVIITSRKERALYIAKEWLKRHNLSIKVVSVGPNAKKTEACIGLDVFIDDDFEKLEPLVSVVPNRFLFSWDYNLHINVEETIAKRVNSWQHFYNEIKSLSKN